MLDSCGDLARSILDNIGGLDNIESVAHCFTRVRFKLVDEGRADTAAIEALPGVLKVIRANGQYQVVVGDKVDEVYEAVLAHGGFEERPPATTVEKPMGLAARAIDLVSGIFQPMIAAFAAAGVMKGLLALIVFTDEWFFAGAFAGSGAYGLLHAVADGMFYFLPVVLALTAARKFRLNEFTALGIAFSLVYPAMAAMADGEVVGSVELGLAGSFSWCADFFGLPLIMPAGGYAGTVVPIVLMVWFASKVEAWCKRWMPRPLKLFFVPLVTMVAAVVSGYLVIGPAAMLVTNLIAALFQGLFGLPAVGSVVGYTLLAGLWMCLVAFGCHWSLIPVAIMNVSVAGYDHILASVVAHSFSLGAVVLAMYLKNRDGEFRALAMPAMVSSFFFGITEPALYGIALPERRALRNACIGSAVGGFVIGLSGAVSYMSGGLGVFNWLSFVDPGVLGNGVAHLVWAVVASLAGAVVGFILEYATYRPER